MIALYSGTPGSGKSLHQAKDIYYRLKYGHPTITNYAINTAAVKKCKGDLLVLDNSQLTPDRLIEYSRDYFKDHKYGEGKIACYIDEAQLLFNARSWDVKGRDKWIGFFTQHRKYGYNIFLIAQFDRMLDRQIRSLLEYEYSHRKVSNFGIKGKLLSAAAGGRLFCAVKVWYPLRERVSAEWFKYHKRYGKIYDTYLDFTGGELVNVQG